MKNLVLQDKKINVAENTNFAKCSSLAGVMDRFVDFHLGEAVPANGKICIGYAHAGLLYYSGPIWVSMGADRLKEFRPGDFLEFEDGKIVKSDSMTKYRVLDCRDSAVQVLIT